ncbi:hypothetical protein [Nostoc sp. C110]|uniref:hypothetical protein n=1 Tax=Nostoc sp. C110 TaxID=3349876 RepID=UPI00370DB03F
MSKHPLQTKQSTLRLEHLVSDRLQDVCRKNGICREVLIEAMFEYCEANPEFLSIVLTEAIAKNDYRQQVANMRRAIAETTAFCTQKGINFTVLESRSQYHSATIFALHMN